MPDHVIGPYFLPRCMDGGMYQVFLQEVLPVLLQKAPSNIVAVVVKWYRYRIVTSSSPVPLKSHRVGQRCTLNMSRAEMSSCWCGVVIRRGGASSGAVHVT
ncbi:uncharacterized protein TNCV_3795251 [Trichonephila clavipes]|nr:uncharacterized protein TNCV_3795251 [Trichonephila clavipes]